MTENKIKEATFEDALYCAKALVGVERCEECRFYTLGDLWCDDTYRIMHEALEEVKAYRAIGTIEEFKALKDKSEPRKPFQPFGTHSYKCPSCWKFVAHEVDDNCDLEAEMAGWCPYCGQKLDWQ